MNKKMRYLMESPHEAERLEAKTSVQAVRDELRLLALGKGMRVLDAGAGTGVVARQILPIVGEGGSVVALDASGGRLRYGCKLARQKGAGIRFVQGEIQATPFCDEAFDLVLCRFVLEYVREPELVVRELRRVIKPNGRVALIDLDSNGLIHFPQPNEIRAGMERLLDVVAGYFDPFIGRKLYYYLRRAGFSQVRVTLRPYHLYAGSVPAAEFQNWVAKFRTIRRLGVRAFGSSAAYDRFVRGFLELLSNQDVFSYSTLCIAEGFAGPVSEA